jgi:hypothetical protein
MDWVGRNLCEFLYYQLLGTTRISSLEFGGLGRNRTIDTRIFNAVLQTKDILFSKFNSGQAKVVCVFCAIADAGAK